MQGIRQDRDTVPGTGSTWVQAIWNQVLQDLQAMEGREQPTCLEQTPQGLFLVQISDQNVRNRCACLEKLGFAPSGLASKLSFCRKPLFSIMYNCKVVFYSWWDSLWMPIWTYSSVSRQWMPIWTYLTMSSTPSLSNLQKIKLSLPSLRGWRFSSTLGVKHSSHSTKCGTAVSRVGGSTLCWIGVGREPLKASRFVSGT